MSGRREFRSAALLGGTWLHEVTRNHTRNPTSPSGRSRSPTAPRRSPGSNAHDWRRSSGRWSVEIPIEANGVRIEPVAAERRRQQPDPRECLDDRLLLIDLALQSPPFGDRVLGTEN